MVGIALREVREENGWARKVIAVMVRVSESLVAEWEHGRRRITDVFRPVLARKLDDGRIYSALAREATGGPTAEPWLNGIDEHPVVGALKLVEELTEAKEAALRMIPFLLTPNGAGKEAAKEWMHHSIEAATAIKNCTARIAKRYGISLAEMWDEHEAELVEKGYLRKEKAAVLSG